VVELNANVIGFGCAKFIVCVLIHPFVSFTVKVYEPAHKFVYGGFEVTGAPEDCNVKV